MNNSPSKGKKLNFKTILGIIGNVLMYVFFALCLFGLIMSIVSKRDKDGTVILFGHEIRFVLTNSMEKCDLTDVSAYKIKDIPKRSVIFVQVVPEDDVKAEEWYANLKIGDVLTFRYYYSTQETITHRLVDITPKEGSGYILTLEGDNKDYDAKLLKQVIDTSDKDSFNYVLGKVTGVSYPLGLLVYVLKQPIGLALIVIVPCAIIIILEVIRIVTAVNAEKKKKADTEKAERQNEIDELKKQLAALQNEQNTKTHEEKEKDDA